MGIGNYIIKKAQKLGANDAVATITSETSRQIKFANNEIVVNQTWDYINVDVFLEYKKRLVSSNFNYPSTIEALSTSSSPKTFSKKSIDDFLTRLIKIAKIIQEKKDYLGIAEGPFKYKPVAKTFDKKITTLGEKGIEFVKNAIDRATKEGANRCAGVLYTSSYEIEKFSSNNIAAKDKGTSINLSMRAFTKNSSGHSVSTSRILRQFQPEKVGEDAGMLAKDSRNPTGGTPGTYTVILHPLIMANLLYHMSYAFSAFEVESGTSFLINKIGKKVGNDIVSITDNPRLENGYNSTTFDEEGRPTQTTKIIDKGILKTYLHNTSTAKKFKVKPTANAGIVYPQPWNIVLEKGDSNLEEMISQVKNGIYITNTWYTRFANYQTGDFSTIPRDAMFEVKDGKLSRPIKELRLTGNMQKILENIVAISKDRKMIQWWEVEKPILTGYALIKNVQMTKSAK